jgi:hypothetical protein
MKTSAGAAKFDGGFPGWLHEFESISFNTIHVTHAFFRAQKKGFDCHCCQ